MKHAEFVFSVANRRDMAGSDDGLDELLAGPMCQTPAKAGGRRNAEGAIARCRTRVAQEAINEVPAGRPEAGLDHDPELHPRGGGHQPRRGLGQTRHDPLAPVFGLEDGDDGRSVDDDTHRHEGRPSAS